MSVITIVYIVLLGAGIAWLIHRTILYSRAQRERETRWAGKLSDDELKALASTYNKGGAGNLRSDLSMVPPSGPTAPNRDRIPSRAATQKRQSPPGKTRPPVTQAQKQKSASGGGKTPQAPTGKPDNSRKTRD